MTFQETVQAFRGKRVGKDRYTALCPHHGDRRPSLSIRRGHSAAMVKCQSQNCALADICKSAGITVQALWYQQRSDPKEIREADRRRRYNDKVRNKLLLQIRDRIAGYERWSRVAAALYWHLLRKPHDKQIEAWYEEALDRCLGDPAPWPKHEPYCPFPPRKLLEGITSRQVSHPQIARLLKLKG